MLERYPNLSECKSDILKALELILDTYKSGGKLLLCGNGGSAADCEHIVGELMKGFLKKRPLDEDKKAQMRRNCPSLDEGVLSKLQNALTAISLPSFCALNTAFSNDVDGELVFAQALLGLAREGDVLLAISTSGNAKNVTECAKVARALGLSVIALTGKDGGMLRELSQVCIIAPERKTYKIQELHLPIYHALCASVEERFFEE